MRKKGKEWNWVNGITNVQNICTMRECDDQMINWCCRFMRQIDWLTILWLIPST